MGRVNCTPVKIYLCLIPILGVCVYTEIFTGNEYQKTRHINNVKVFPQFLCATRKFLLPNKLHNKTVLVSTGDSKISSLCRQIVSTTMLYSLL